MTTTISPAACFSSSYGAARAAFLDACAAAGGAIVAHRHPQLGPDGAPLFLDEARFGAAGARRVLFVASGTHGIEGFCGSGIQQFLLRSGLASRLPDGVALVFVHAVNPWGFAWLRRVNEDNVDVNRNFLDHRAPHPLNPDYDLLYDTFNPARLDDDTVRAGLQALRDFEATRGGEASYRAMSGGQYKHPHGVQYGGREAVWSNRVLRALWARYLGGAELAAYVDLHSGLGPTGFGMLLQTAAANSTAARLASAWWPDVIRAEPEQDGDAALASGLIGPAFCAAQPQCDAVGVVLEFGTINLTRVMLAVQADNWLHQQAAADPQRATAIGEEMRAAFFVDDEAWKEQVCRRTAEVVEQALAGAAAHVPAKA